ncbi:hypothetical protein H6G89_01605 [Oscillatoria sp. FACHB-1407]|uniref:hypothetical protein n=1 Tax=Oscillatoria sp. FACHB-1407 TaxID=2692847 RepID=UPI001684F2DE|nr:hypothetical protein [Oscillatoria sp. FACHB-1407]MBD2459727.1 hypothetical protein [Oscillatoria sp. FACHB-1407]
MQPSTLAPTIEEITNRIVASGRITRADERFLLRAATSEQPLSDRDMRQVKHVLDRLKMGLLRVVD